MSDQQEAIDWDALENVTWGAITGTWHDADEETPEPSETDTERP